MTLTEINFYARKMAPFGVILVLVGMVIFFGFKLLFMLVSSQAPSNVQQSVLVSLDPKFNTLKRVEIPSSLSSGLFTYTLDTLDGTTSVEDATAAASVFFLPKHAPTFGFLTEIYSLAKTTGIDTQMTKHTLSGQSAEFNDGKRRFVIDIDSFNFNYDYTITPEDDLFDVTRFPTEAAFESKANAFLDKLKKYPNEFARGKRNIVYMFYDQASRQIRTLDSADGANMAEIDYYRPDIDKRPIVTSTYYNSPHFVLMAAHKGDPFIVRAQTRYFERSLDQVGTYPIRSSEQAWQDLKGGRGLVIAGDQAQKQTKIKKIFLAYYEPDVYQEYMQPVYVFLGDNRFIAYVPAVTDEYLR